jgi:hypothetical protein
MPSVMYISACTSREDHNRSQIAVMNGLHVVRGEVIRKYQSTRLATCSVHGRVAVWEIDSASLVQQELCSTQIPVYCMLITQKVKSRMELWRSVNSLCPLLLAGGDA